MSTDDQSTELYPAEFDPLNGTDDGHNYLIDMTSLVAKLNRGEARHFTDEALDRICAAANVIASAAQAERRFRS